MTFFSHIRRDETGAVVSRKTLMDHVGTMQKYAGEELCSIVDSENNAIDFSPLLNRIVLYHDFGKFTTFFQQYLQGEETDRDLRRHSATGALMAYNELQEKGSKNALLALYVIARHHANLCDVQSFGGRLMDDHLQRIFQAHQVDLNNRLDIIEEHLGETNLKKVLEYPDERTIRKGFKQWIKKDASIRDYYLVNYIFSLLLEADKLDASETKPYRLKPVSPRCVDERFGVPQSINGTSPSELSDNELRNFCRAEVVSMLDRKDILSHKLFTLTAPTGIGKTMTALDFAVKLKALVGREKKKEPQIIYALPFINIIEQALDEYQKTLPKDVNVLAHYQFADVFGKENEKNDRGSDAVRNYNQKVMLMDTWQSDVVITSFVQFFETLIGHRNKLLKKFHHLANAIVILDEVQTLRLDQMPLIGAALHYLARHLNTRIVLMTATRPKIFELAQTEILNPENDELKTFELLPSHKEIFALFRRTRIVPLLSDKASLEEETAGFFVENLFSVNWSSDQSCLIVCNTVNRSIQLYQAVSEFLEDEGFKNPVQYLSTNIVPIHRRERIEVIRQQLERGDAPVLVATQVVEAGVDLDFDMGFRDIGPIDSIIQVAGRINRNNRSGKEHAPLYIVNFGDAHKIYGQITVAQTEKALSGKDVFYEEEFYDLVEQYFDNIASRSSFSRYNKIFESMKYLRYDLADLEEERPVSAFKIIEEQAFNKSVFIELNEEAAQIRDKYMEKITGHLSKEVFDKDYKVLFQQHIITVPDYFTKTLSPINEYDDNLLVIDQEIVDDYYNQITGFIRDQTDGAMIL